MGSGSKPREETAPAAVCRQDLWQQILSDDMAAAGLSGLALEPLLDRIEGRARATRDE